MAPPRLTPPSDPFVKVTIQMPASLLVTLREHAATTGTNLSRLCREGAARTMAEATAEVTP